MTGTVCDDGITIIKYAPKDTNKSTDTKNHIFIFFIVLYNIMNGNKVNNSPPPAKSNTMMYIGILILVIVIVVISVVSWLYMKKTKSGNDDEFTASAYGSTNVLTELNIDADDFTLRNNDEKGSVEIVNTINDKVVWTSNSPGGDSVAWIIDKDGVFRVYHNTGDDDKWKSVKAAVISDKTLIGETNGPYSYEFTNKGVLSTYNKNKKLIWDTKSGDMVDDTTKTYSEGNTTVSTLVNTTNTNSVNVTLST
jgi:uncharacterized protein (UPF0333 family)